MIRSTSQNRMDDIQLPARMINEFAYCPRLFYLEFVDGLFSHNRYTVEGSFVHRNVDRKEDPLKSPENDQEPEKIHARSVSLNSPNLNVVAKLDLIEGAGNRVTPVDYKRGKPKTADDGSLTAWDPERIQICVQALLLRENGYQVDEGVIFFHQTRQRVTIPIDDDLIRLTLDTIDQARRVAQSLIIPPPLVDSPKCPKCSLVNICLPDEVNLCRKLGPKNNQDEQQLLFSIDYHSDSSPTGPAKSGEIRGIVARDSDRKSAYINTPGASVGKSGNVLKIKEKKEVIQEIRLKDLAQLNLMGPVQVTTQAMQTLLQAEIPVLYFTGGNWFYGMTQSIGLKNIHWRREQFRHADDPAFCLRLARQLVDGKIQNCRTLLKRNHDGDASGATGQLKSLSRDVLHASSLDELLGLEGAAARIYFSEFSGMIRQKGGEATKEAESASRVQDEGPSGPEKPLRWTFDFNRRNRRPPADPVNALLSLGYSLLSKDLAVIIAGVGLDPLLGYYHQARFGRPALALDLMEPFRPLIVDSAVLRAINNRMVTATDFIQVGNSVALTPGGRKSFFKAYEFRMNQEIIHPLFGYRASYRRILEIQVRLLARVLTGELNEYPVFVNR